MSCLSGCPVQIVHKKMCGFTLNYYYYFWSLFTTTTLGLSLLLLLWDSLYYYYFGSLLILELSSLANPAYTRRG
eukprot:COSAG02_NODE_3481_length_6671_cov_12.360012_2_plen_74_part_00